jgi:hypothetical protein
MPADPSDKRLQSEQTFRPKADMPLEKCTIHKYRKVFNDKKHKYETKWVRLRIGKKAAKLISDASKSVKEVSELTDIPSHEVFYYRERYNIGQQSKSEQTTEDLKSKYLRYTEEAYSSYDDIRLGEAGPTLYENRLVPDLDNPRMFVVERNPIRR